ncbi:calcium/sodium antiporter [Kordia algicida OT-1]|uniref:Putative sodium/calcium exchanger n=1 Tax=Kordia algicida OT-1 TaxID=391587 RepID=A9E8Q9_9FLAO|nr:calcium/sodium antiporter [Kordia algicida]EDP94793.1 putative sodium/calcium exchanger [Kordia algicida OT-1]
MENIAYVIFGLLLLIAGGEFLVRASVGLSFKLNISKMVIGLTVVSFATSAPELLVSINAALNGLSAIAINNVIGSNIANIGLVLGITAIIGPIAVNNTFYKLTWPSLMFFSLLIYYFLWNDNLLTRLEGIVLLIALGVFLFILIRSARKNKDAIDIEEVDDAAATISYIKILIWLAVGGTALYFGSEFLVTGAKAVAENLGVSEAVISITMIAIGTSVPELAASVIAAVRQEKAISLGNLIGSNIFNIASVLGITSVITQIRVEDTLIIDRDILWMLGFAFVLFPLAFIPKKFGIERYEGVLLFLAYITFIYLVF